MAPPIRHPGTSRLLLLVLGAALILLHAGSNSLSLPNCPDKCGNVSIPYPFGIGEDCYLHEDFNVTCDEYGRALIRTGEEEYAYSEVLDFDLPNGEARIQNSMYWNCNENNDGSRYVVLSLRNALKVSYTKNRFTAIGCATVATIVGSKVAHEDDDNWHYTTACASFCDNGGDAISKSPECDGMGCCQTSIPANLSAFRLDFFYDKRLINNPYAKSFSPCSYVFVCEANSFKFEASYALQKNFMEHAALPLVLDWRVGDQTCDEAKKNSSSYACRAINSECINVTNGAGYRCNCSEGYEGNPYLVEGCQDINECDSPGQYPCNGTCTNTKGTYDCACPEGTYSEDPKTKPCTPKTSQPQLKVVIGTCIGIVLGIICVFALMIRGQKLRLVKEKERFFKQNGGHILYQQILSKQIDTVIIFTIEDLKKATNNFDRNREIGAGGNGIVYKGILGCNKRVAVKRSKSIDVAKTEEFVQEIIILSQINHKNVVRLIGCCLEVEVPILVYEFIPNGTLYQLIHKNHGRPPVSLETRLRIAQESAEALAYMHLSINHPIVHGDVKSLNILLGENHMAKVTDFGASRLLPNDEAQLMTMVKGTLGYLDPEYLQERILTEKSDVYSFGVVLLELITRKTAIYSEGPSNERKNLASSFLQAMRENRVVGFLDTSIFNAEMEKLFQEVADLACLCLSSKGAERPSMIQVADKLKAIRNTWREILLLKCEETHQLPIGRIGMDLICDLPPSMAYTAQMLGLDIEISSTDHAKK